MFRHITDWDDAYANGANIPGGDRWPALWVEPAAAYRARMLTQGHAKLDVRYGDGPRNLLDLFLPTTTPRGLMVFVHGGFWMRLDKSFWSHLANGAVEHGYAVAMPSYTLCPEASIAGITREIARAIAVAAETIAGPIRLVGHSAGGHLVTRMACEASPLPAEIRQRIANVVSISGLHDLRPLQRTAMNATLRIDDAVASTESPALLAPVADARVTCWVGGAERAEFRRQSQLLANVWTGLGATTRYVEEPDRHHFDVIDSLADRNSAMVDALMA